MIVNVEKTKCTICKKEIEHVTLEDFCDLCNGDGCESCSFTGVISDDELPFCEDCYDDDVC